MAHGCGSYGTDPCRHFAWSIERLRTWHQPPGWLGMTRGRKVYPGTGCVSRSRSFTYSDALALAAAVSVVGPAAGVSWSCWLERSSYLDRIPQTTVLVRAQDAARGARRSGLRPTRGVLAVMGRRSGGYPLRSGALVFSHDPKWPLGATSGSSQDRPKLVHKGILQPG